MSASIFSETELARLASFPEEIPSDDLIRAFTRTGADRDLVVIRRGAANRLGLALQLGALRYLGFVPRNLSAAPRSAACFVADQLEVSPDEIQSYARREPTPAFLSSPRNGSPKPECYNRVVHAGSSLYSDSSFAVQTKGNRWHAWRHTGIGRPTKGADHRLGSLAPQHQLIPIFRRVFVQ